MVLIENCPPGPLLFVINVINTICVAINLPNWRDFLPWGLGDAEKNGLLSHPLPDSISESLPKMPSYADFLAEHSYERSFSSYYQFAFKTPSTSLGVLTTPDAMVVLLVLVLILREIKRFVLPKFSAIGRHLANISHGSEWVKSNEEKVTKFGEYLFRLLFHSSVSISGIYYFCDKPWWDPARGGAANMFIDFPNQPIGVSMTWYYLIQGAYNIDAMMHLLELSFVATWRKPIAESGRIQTPLNIKWSPTCRGDFQEMAIHHIITNILVIGSSHMRLTIIGSMVFMVHDVSDVPVDLSKLANFMKWKTSTTVCFVLMVIVWLVTRLGIFPFYIFRGIVQNVHIVYTEGVIDERFARMYTGLFVGLLVAIITLHLVWFLMFIKMGYYLVNKGEAHDLSEHKKGEKTIAPIKKNQQ